MWFCNMTRKSQTISIRLLRAGRLPGDSVRDGVTLLAWEKLSGSHISLDTIGGGAPKWATFLELSVEEKLQLNNSTASRGGDSHP